MHVCRSKEMPMRERGRVFGGHKLEEDVGSTD